MVRLRAARLEASIRGGGEGSGPGAGRIQPEFRKPNNRNP